MTYTAVIDLDDILQKLIETGDPERYSYAFAATAAYNRLCDAATECLRFGLMPSGSGWFRMEIGIDLEDEIAATEFKLRHDIPMRIVGDGVA